MFQKPYKNIDIEVDFFLNEGSVKEALEALQNKFSDLCIAGSNILVRMLQKPSKTCY